MTDEELRESARNNYAAQMEMLGYQTDGNPKDMVEVVRCKDCVFADKYAPGCSENEYRCVSAELQGCDAYHDGNWFCADGKRR